MSIAAGLIKDAGTGPAPAEAIDLGRVALMPALVNAHTHLELSYLGGRVPPGGPFDQWIRTLMAIRRQYPDPAASEIIDAARAAIAAARASGTGLVGDISNTLVTVPLLRDASMSAQVFYELLGFRESNPHARVADAHAKVLDCGAEGDVRVALAPHAPYSVSPPLIAAIRQDIDRHASPVTSVHLAESRAEVQFVHDGTGALRSLLEELGVWTDEWRGVLPAGVSPVAYLSSLGFLDGCVLVVHAVQCEGEDLARLASLGATIVSCPRSNRHVGVGSPPLEAFYAMDVPVAFGTDSLASAPDLNMFAELAEARRIAPRVPARRLLHSATLAAARALRFDDDFGSIETGKRAAVIGVRVPDSITDVEEYLVSGVEPERVFWPPGHA